MALSFQFMVQIIDSYRFAVVMRRRHELEVSRVCSAMGDTSTPFLILKGWVSELMYPPDLYRQFSDVDIAVPATKNAFFEIDLLSMGIAVDIHFGFRHLDPLPFETLYANRREVLIDGNVVTFPSAEDHLRILAVHWLTDGGEYKERLWDIYYAVANRPAEFDWNKCLDVVSPTRRKWVITTIGLAHKYLGLEIDDLPFAEEAKQIPQWIIDTVEREWARDLRLIPLRISYRDPKKLIQQIRKRLPPNPITATIDMEGEFDDRSRVWYQLGSIAKRIPPGVKRFVDIAKARLGRKNADQSR